MNFNMFCQILGDNLVFEPTSNLPADEWQEWQHELYVIYKDASYAISDRYVTNEERVIAWMRDHFSECSFDSHNFQLKES
jgi:glyoxylate utilization-related uncharacterized protein